MQIDVVDRSFLSRKTASEWAAMLEDARVISIRSTDGWDRTFPVPPGIRPNANLLCLTFDDCTSMDEAYREHEDPILFNIEKARAVVELAKDDGLPLIVQCTAGISRSGAIGFALDEFFNVRDDQNPEDHEYFVMSNPGIRPNALVLRLMREALGELEDKGKDQTNG